MKLAFLIIAFLTLGSQAFACIDSNDNRICRGDTVYPDDLNHRGAKVLAVNSHTQKVTVRSNASGSTYRYSADRLALPSGCLGNAALSFVPSP